jgi:hypothetical protein
MSKIPAYAALGLAAIVVAFGLWLGHFVWPQKDYAAEGICTAEQIDRTYTAIEAMHGWHDATAMRVSAETAARPLRTVQSAIARSVNLQVDMRFARRHTAAFSCGHTYVRINAEKPFTVLPLAAARLRPLTGSPEESWKLAQCLAFRGYSPAFPDGTAPLNIALLRKTCEIRAASRARQS